MPAAIRRRQVHPDLDGLSDVLHRQPAKLAPNQVFFAHMILMDSASGNAFCLGRTYIITRDKPEPLSKYPLRMILR